MSKPELIVMLTKNDYTIKNALALFELCKNTPAKYWGAKEKGIPPKELKNLFSVIKAAGKFAVLEVVAYDEENSLAGARLAAECGCDLLMGTVYFDSVSKICKEHSIKYLPFIGDVSERPSVLKGTVEEILKSAVDYSKKGVDGFDLLGYRYAEGDCGELCYSFVKNVKLPTCLAGSINSFERLSEIKEISPAFFTIGSAFWERAFGEDIVTEIEDVYRYIND